MVRNADGGCKLDTGLMGLLHYAKYNYIQQTIQQTISAEKSADM